jgi:hypothetical protein
LARPNTSFEETFAALGDVMRKGKARCAGGLIFRLARLEASMGLRRIGRVMLGLDVEKWRLSRHPGGSCRRLAGWVPPARPAMRPGCGGSRRS